MVALFLFVFLGGLASAGSLSPSCPIRKPEAANYRAATRPGRGSAGRGGSYRRTGLYACARTPRGARADTTLSQPSPTWAQLCGGKGVWEFGWGRGRTRGTGEQDLKGCLRVGLAAWQAPPAGRSPTLSFCG